MDALFVAENAAYIWLVAGALLLALEAFGAPGVGFLFAGLAAIVTAVLVDQGIAANTDPLAQFAWFFGVTVAWTLLLWKPLKKFRTSKSAAGEYNNMIGSTAMVTDGPLEKGKAGTVKWSGTIMQAELAEDVTVEKLEDDAAVVIREVKGTVLFVAPKG